MEAAPVDNLNLSGSIAYLDAHYTSFPGAVYYAPNPFPAAPPGVTCPAGSGVGGGASVCSFDGDGQRLNYSPKWTATAGISYTIPTGAGDFTLNSFAKYVTHQYSAPGNLAVIPKRLLVNGSIGWKSENDRFGVRVWANNIFDEKYLNGVLEEAIGQLQVPGDPRTYGVTLSVGI
jgi:iron complex outermembrane receptor protein